MLNPGLTGRKPPCGCVRNIDRLPPGLPLKLPRKLPLCGAGETSGKPRGVLGNITGGWIPLLVPALLEGVSHSVPNAPSGHTPQVQGGKTPWDRTASSSSSTSLLPNKRDMFPGPSCSLTKQVKKRDWGLRSLNRSWAVPISTFFCVSFGHLRLSRNLSVSYNCLIY